MLTLSTLLERELGGGATVVTPSPQRAASIRLACSVTQLDRKRRAWRTPDAIAYRSWLEREAFRAADAGEPIPRPLRAAEEWLLWREAAARAMPDASGLATSGPADRLADSLSHAARLMFDWRIPPETLRRSGSEESELLARALVHIETRTSEARAAASHALCALLRGWRPRRPVTFAGFLERTAARDAWMRSATEGSRLPEDAAAVREHIGDAARAPSFTACAGDPDEELQLAAAWTRSQLEADPDRRLLVIVPDLAQRGSGAVRLFEQVLAPRGALGRDQGASHVAVEGGEPLGGFPLVRHALAALKFLTGALELTELSAWLRASFWRAPETAERARLDAWLRGVLGTEVAPAGLIAALQAPPAPLGVAAGALRGALEAAARALGSAGEAVPLHGWARRFDLALEALGWPGARPPSSAEQQTKARFAEVLGDFAAIGGHLGTLAAPEAVRMLGALAGRTAFAPATGDTAVTLTSALTDPIVRYDGIWVAGLHADAWPPAPTINPFIPLAAQRRAGIPGVTAAGSLLRARGLIDLWQRSAAQLVLSWPSRIDDRDCLASPLLTERSDIRPWTSDGRAPALAQSIRAARRVESFADDSGIPWPAAVPLPGGTRAIDYQSRCSFRSYAELRLSSVPLETPRPGIDPRERGRLMHRALEHLWRELGGSERLQRESAGGTLERLIEDCVARAADETAEPGSSLPARGARRRERRRIVRLLLDLAAAERQRPAFRVSALERRVTLELSGARLELRIDRLDELEDGALAILDYKTGKPTPLDWLSERLSDPQLLVYLLAAGENVAALAAVHLTTERIVYRGMADRPGRLPRLPALSAEGAAAPAAAWQRQVGRWRALLEQLAAGFLAGSAAVDPSESACRVCHLHTFCRVSALEEAPQTPSGAAADD